MKTNDHWSNHRHDCTRRMGSAYVCTCGAEQPVDGTRMTTAAVERSVGTVQRCDHGVSLSEPCSDCHFKVTTVLGGVDIDSILAERGKQHGKFQSHAEVTQDLKAVMWNFEIDGKQPFMELAPDQRESLEMIQHKVGRILNGNPNIADHWADIAGYAKLIADRLEGKIV